MAPRPWWLDLEPEPRRRAHRLTDDLRALGVAAAESQALPCAAIPKVASAADLLGVLYVREGATLGGRLLARKLEPLCGPDGAGRSFFIGTPHDGALWAELCTTLDRFGNKQHIATMTQAACATFAALEAWLDGNQLIESGKPP